MNIIFCIPGRSFSDNFLRSWTATVNLFHFKNWNFKLINAYSSNVYFSRGKCLGYNTLRGKNQKPFDGKLEYDFVFWIDSDIVWKPEQVIRLINWNKDIVSGIYLCEGEEVYPTVINWDLQFFKNNGYFEFLNKDRAEEELKKSDLLEVSYNGMGFMAVKYGVFESIGYSPFAPIFTKIEKEKIEKKEKSEKEESVEIVDFASEDVSFCLRAGRIGYKVYADLGVKVGHEKSNILI